MHISYIFTINQKHVLISAMQGCVLDCSCYLAPRSRYDLDGYASFAITSSISFKPHDTNFPQVNTQTQVQVLISNELRTELGNLKIFGETRPVRSKQPRYLT